MTRGYALILTLLAATNSVGAQPHPTEPAGTFSFEDGKLPVATHAGKKTRGRRGAVHQAAEQYRTTEDAPILERHGTVLFPFDESQPVVRCSPLRACDIELEAGEVIRDVALGDSERWLAKPLASGEVDRTVPHVVVKPTEHGLSTNLVIGTTRRTYHLRLQSPKREDLQPGLKRGAGSRRAGRRRRR